MSDECGHVIAALLCKTCVERDFEAQKELTAFYVEKLNKAEAEIERLSFAEAVLIDREIRYVVGQREPWFVHKSLKPLDEVDFSTDKTASAEDRSQLNMFNNECKGMCGV